jgi:hypothetical protein
MVYRGPGFLSRRMIWLLPHPSPLSRQQVVSLSQSSCVSPIQLTDGREGGEGAKSYDTRMPDPP